MTQRQKNGSGERKTKERKQEGERKREWRRGREKERKGRRKGKAEKEGERNTFIVVSVPKLQPTTGPG